MNTVVPVLPETAPFTPEQRAYLNGFLAGLFSRGPAPASSTTAAGPDKRLRPLTILFGSQTGNCESLAKRTAKQAAQHGFAPTVQELAKFPVAQLSKEENVLILTSTYGDGEPPDNARIFWEALSHSSAPEIKSVRFSLLALGDSNYPKFCGFGKALDARLAELGASRIHPRCDCDLDYEPAFADWTTAALGALLAADATSPTALSRPAPAALARRVEDVESATPLYSRNNPYPARLLASRKLCGLSSAKDVRHVELALGDSGLTYEAGDALGVFPANDPTTVDELLSALGCDGEEAVPGRSGEIVPLRLALLSHYDITRIPQPLLSAFAAQSGDAELKRFASPEPNGELPKYLFGREITDLFLAHPQVKFTAPAFIALLRKLAPRLYSISSSLKVHPGQVHLTVGVLRYESFGRQRQGVCSSFLAERAQSGPAVPIFVQANKAFRLPASDTPIIMVGPGTGIAPFRAFLQERQATGAKGRNWLFFGDQHAATDFLYRAELESMRQAGTLHRLDTAFSRDQAEKLYVQHRMHAQAKELYAWLAEGACFYVCGDANRMARDVHKALHTVLEVGGNLSPEKAAEMVQQMQAQGRYHRDVY